jgi:long-subunit acyl-CoA synthetase (AMP-forming)
MRARRGDVAELLDDVLELRPTIFTSVPRLYNRIYDRVMGTIAQVTTPPWALVYSLSSSPKTKETRDMETRKAELAI